MPRFPSQKFAHRFPNPAATSPNHAATFPNRAATAPNRAATAPNHAATAPNRAATAPNPAATTPNPAATAPNRAATVRERSFALLVPALLLLLTACDPPGKPKATENPQAASLDFKTIYSQNCEACHGIDGKNGPGRILNDSLYLAILPRDTLRQILIHGRAGTSMPAWAQSDGGPLNPKQIDALVDGIYKNWAKPDQFTGQSLPPYAVGDEKGDSDSGRKLFARNCFMCHGPGARVGLITDPNYLSLVSNQMLRTSILVGRPDFGMPDYRNLKAGKALSSQDVADVVAFLVSKRPPDSATAQSTQGSASGSHANEGDETKGSGHGPGSPTQRTGDGNKSHGGSSQQGVK